MTVFRSRHQLAAAGALAAALALSACGGEQSPPVDPEPAMAAEPTAGDYTMTMVLDGVEAVQTVTVTA